MFKGGHFYYACFLSGKSENFKVFLDFGIPEKIPFLQWTLAEKKDLCINMSTVSGNNNMYKTYIKAPTVYFRKAGYARKRNKKEYILLNFGQFEDETSRMQI